MTLARLTVFRCLSAGTLHYRGFPEGFGAGLSRDLEAENHRAMPRELKDQMGQNLGLSKDCRDWPDTGFSEYMSARAIQEAGAAEEGRQEGGGQYEGEEEDCYVPSTSCKDRPRVCQHQ